MNKSKLNFSLFLFSLLFSTGYSQTLEELKIMDKSYQSCLDEGKNMANCSQLYSTELNAFVIKTYNTLFEKTDKADQYKLKKGQQQWLGEKDIYYEKLARDYAADITNDSRMITIDKRATFVRNRIAKLLEGLRAVEMK